MKRRLQFLMSLFLILLLPQRLFSQDQRGPIDRHEFERWLDEFIATYAGQSATPTIGFVLVKGGNIFVEKGYGDSPTVIPNQTLFRAASVSKLVTATAVMQLVERRQITLDTDVNTYLKSFQLKNTYAKPVTVASLLTHTSGIDDTSIGNSVPNAALLPKLGDYFSQHLPRRIRPPNEEIAYSNRGMALAGHLVEAVSGLPFEEYVERNIFQPLAMTRSSFRQPYPAHLASSVVPSGADEGAIILYPSGSLIATVDDMGHFIAAHLNDGRYDNAQVLSPESVREMHRRQFSQHQQMPGIGYGFFENYTNGIRVLFHTGLSGHQSILCLIPDERIGFYIALSARQGGPWQEFRTRFLQAFMDRYFPPTQPFTLPPSPDFQSRASRFVGTFRPHLLSVTTVEKLGNLVMDTLVVDNHDGSLSVQLPPFGAKRFRLVEVAPLLFRSDDGFYFAFAEDEKGNINRMFMSGSTIDPVGFERLRWFERGLLHLVFGAFGFLIALSFVVVSLIGGVVHWFIRKKGRDVDVESKTARLGWVMAMLVTSMIVVSPVVALAVYFLGEPEMRPYKVTTALYPSLTLLLIASILGLTLPVFAVILWRRRQYSVLRRVYYSLVALMGLVMPAYLYYWNWLGFRFL